MLAEDRSDPFLRYSLAMELDKDGEHERSLAEFSTLMAADVPYVPAYFMAAQQLVRLDRIAEARVALGEGIQQAAAAGNDHAAAEMGELLSQLVSTGLGAKD